MSGHRGFEHNAHSLRVVEELGKRYPLFPGSNLTWEVREGITKHNPEHDRPGAADEYEKGMASSLEAQIVDIADEIAYNNHDIDDGLSSGMIEPDMMKDVEIWQENFKEVKKSHENVDFKILKYQTIVRIINSQVTDLVSNISSALEEEGIRSAADVRKRKALACFSRPMTAKNVELRKFLKKNLYEHYRLVRMADKAERMLEGLFNAYMRELEASAAAFLF